MQRLWLGDALDFWKGTFLAVLRASSTPPLPLKVLPMFTDAGWTPAEVDTYAAILGVPTSALLSTSQLNQPARSNYFAGYVRLREDVFVDPDTGIATGRPKPSHVTPGEIVGMLSGDNVVAVYQHRPQRVAAGWLVKYAQLLTAAGAVTIGYEAGQVGMLFNTRSPARETGIRRSLTLRLGAVAVVRGDIPGRVL
jgi:hypothetical protein